MPREVGKAAIVERGQGVVHHKERDESDMKKEKTVQVQQRPMLYTQPLVHYHQIIQRNRLHNKYIIKNLPSSGGTDNRSCQYFKTLTTALLKKDYE